MAKASAVGSPAASASLAAILLNVLLPLKPLLLIVVPESIKRSPASARDNCSGLHKAQTKKKSRLADIWWWIERTCDQTHSANVTETFLFHDGVLYRASGSESETVSVAANVSANVATSAAYYGPASGSESDHVALLGTWK